MTSEAPQTALASPRADIKRNLKALKAQPMPAEVKAYFEGTVWPFLDSLAETVDDELEELGVAVEGLIEESDEAIHAETGGKIMKVVTDGQLLVLELKKRLPPGDPLLARCDVFSKESVEVVEILVEITIPDEEETSTPGAPDPDEEDDDEDDDDEEEDDDVG